MERIDEHVNYNCIYADADVVRKQYAENLKRIGNILTYSML